MKRFKLFITLIIMSFILSGCNNNKNILPEHIKEKEINDTIYYIINDKVEYKGEYHIDTVYSDNFVNANVGETDKEYEVSPEGIVYDYYNFKPEGEIMTYDEYCKYCKSYKLEPYYTDKDSNYFIISYGTGGSWIDVILAGVVNKNNSIDIYIWDNTYGIMGSGSAYILTIPTKLSKEADINIVSCINKEEYLNLKTYGFYHNPYEVTCDKPVIYLYPEQETEVKVDLNINGKFSCTYPLYKNGWKVTAMPDGTLYDDNGLKYKYLFWEATTNKKWNLDEGFCVKGNETLEFFEEILPKLGLNRSEINDFITYWLPQMQNNKYNIISFQTTDYTDDFKLTTYPEADSIIRVFMTWKSSENKIEIQEQKITMPERKGFTVVEWGGSKIN